MTEILYAYRDTKGRYIIIPDDQPVYAWHPETGEENLIRSATWRAEVVGVRYRFTKDCKDYHYWSAEAAKEQSESIARLAKAKEVTL